MKQKEKERFLELRISGKTFQEISEELKVSKQTLINWSKEEELKEAITTARLMKYQSILQVYKQNREAKVTYYASLNQKAQQELMKRDFSEIPLISY